MIPPNWVVSALENLDPNVRLAWMGGDFDPSTQHADSAWDFLLPQAKAELEDTINVGQFYVVKLFHKRDAEVTLHTPWDGAGPVYGSRYDPLERTPVILQPVTKTSVFNGAVVRIVRDMLRPWRKVVYESAREADYQANKERNDLYSEMGDRLWHRAKSAHGSHTVLAKKFVDRETKRKAAGERSSFLDTYYQDAYK